MKKFGIFAVLFVFNLLLNTFTLSAYPLNEKLEGTLEIMAVDGKDPQSGQFRNCSTRYFIRTDDGERHQISLPLTAPPNLSAGQKIAVSGRWEDMRRNFIGEDIKIIGNAPSTTSATNTVHITANSYLGQQTLNNPESCGQQKTLVVMLGFTDIPVPTKTNKEAIEDVVFNNPLSVNAFWKECSNNKMWLEGGCLPEVVILPYPASYFGYDQQDELNHQIDLLRKAIACSDDYVDFNQYHRIIFVRTGDRWGYDFSTVGKWGIQTQDGDVSMSVAFVTEGDINLRLDYISHEYGHSLGLDHANSIFITTGELTIYGDDRSVMGSRYSQIDNYDRNQFGWLRLNKIKMLELYGTITVWVDQRELSSGGIKLLAIPLGFDPNGKPIFYYLEYFKALGKFDSKIFYRDEKKEKDKVVLRKYEPTIYGNSWVLMEGKNSDYQYSLDLESKEYYDSSAGVSIQVLQKTGKGQYSKAEVRINLQNPPSPSITLDAKISDSRGIKINLNTKDATGIYLQTDKIVCQIYNSEGKLVFNRSKIGKPFINFYYKTKDVGFYKVKVMASKDGYVGVVVETNFEIK